MNPYSLSGTSILRSRMSGETRLKRTDILEVVDTTLRIKLSVPYGTPTARQHSGHYALEGGKARSVGTPGICFLQSTKRRSRRPQCELHSPGPHFLQRDLHKAVPQRTLRVRRAKQWLQSVLNCRPSAAPFA